MELWIRSQDKMKLIKCENIMISKGTFAYEYLETPLCKEYEKKDCWYVWANETIIGKYSVEQRALEVLDEIQNILNLKNMYKYDRELVLKSWENVDEEQVKKVRQQMSVYEMPLD